MRPDHVIENFKSLVCGQLSAFTMTNKSQVCWKSVEGRCNNNIRDADTQSLRHAGACFISFTLASLTQPSVELGASGQRRKVETCLKRRSALEALRQVKQSHETRIALTAYRKAVE